MTRTEALAIGRRIMHDPPLSAHRPWGVPYEERIADELMKAFDAGAEAERHDTSTPSTLTQAGDRETGGERERG